MTMASMPAKTPQVFTAVKALAKAQKTPAYGQVGAQVGLSPRVVHIRLYAIWQWCARNNHPHLNGIVVNKRTGLPGSGYTPFGHPVTWAEFQKIKSAVLAYDWEPVRFPGT